MLAYLCIATEAGASLIRRVQILDRFDLTDEEIAKVCRCSRQSVRNARSLGKKKGKKGK
jgi:DNA-directed RNA polymerase specialized sigma24 family protein